MPTSDIENSSASTSWPQIATTYLNLMWSGAQKQYAEFESLNFSHWALQTFWWFLWAMFFPGRFLGPRKRCVEVPKILQGLHTFELLLAVLCPQWRCQDLGMSPDSARSWLTHGIFAFKVWSFKKNIRHKTTEQEKNTKKMPTLHLSFFHWPHIPWPHRELHPNVSNQRISPRRSPGASC